MSELTTSGGIKLIERGPKQSKADFWAHVCFDSYWGSPRIFVYKRSKAAEKVEEFSEDAKYGSRLGNSQRNTGWGVNLLPKEDLEAEEILFTPDPEFANLPLGKMGEKEIKKLYQNMGYLVEEVDKKGQMAGTDWKCSKDGKSFTIEVKSRGVDKEYPKIFIQTYEANPDKRFT